MASPTQNIKWIDKISYLCKEYHDWMFVFSNDQDKSYLKRLEDYKKTKMTISS